MAPATKRRKLKHEEENSESDVSSSEDISHAAIASDDDEREASDASMDSLDDAGDDGTSHDDSLEDDEDDEEGEEGEEATEAATKLQKSNLKNKDGEKPKSHRQPGAHVQEGAYTAETFKSNVFKLQVDELLDQVKLKYGKKEVPAENAMRTLKAIIEQIPNREPQLVRSHFRARKSQLTTLPSSPKRRRASNPLV